MQGLPGVVMISLVMKIITQSKPFKILPFILPLLASSGPSLEASIIFIETFETDGEGSRYNSTGSFTDGSDDYFMRTDGITEASGIPAFTGFEGSYFWAAEDIDAAENTSGVALLDFSNISLGQSPQIQISLDLGAGSNSAFDSVDDFLLVQYSFDTGPWQSALAFQNNGQTFNGPLLHDTDFDSIGDGAELGLAFQTIASGSIPVTGTLMNIRIDTLMKRSHRIRQPASHFRARTEYNRPGLCHCLHAAAVDKTISPTKGD